MNRKGKKRNRQGIGIVVKDEVLNLTGMAWTMGMVLTESEDGILESISIDLGLIEE